MAWVTPRTWVTGELVTAAELNEQIRDNLGYLLTPAYFLLTSASAFTTTSASYGAVNAAMTSASITCTGAHWLFGHSGWQSNSASGNIDLAVAHDAANEVVILRHNSAGLFYAATVLKIGIAAGAHTFSLRWRTSAGTATMRGADNGGVAIGQIIFWGIEI